MWKSGSSTEIRTRALERDPARFRGFHHLHSKDIHPGGDEEQVMPSRAFRWVANGALTCGFASETRRSPALQLLLTPRSGGCVTFSHYLVA